MKNAFSFLLCMSQEYVFFSHSSAIFRFRESGSNKRLICHDDYGKKKKSRRESSSSETTDSE